jgi:RNA polymerase sigma-70 factor (ECF subfamily)
MRLLENPRAVQEVQCFAAWLRRSVVNESINAVRRRRRQRAVEEDLLRRGPKAGNGFETGSALLETVEELKRLDGALRELAPEERVVLALRFDEDLTFQEISRTLDWPLSTVKSRCERAVDQLRKTFRRLENGGRLNRNPESEE